MIEVGKIIDDRYEILKEIDRGGMSIIYLAADSRLKKSVVLKDIRKGDKIEDEILLGCLKAEADLLTALDHPNLPKIYDIIEGFDHIYVVMDYIEGESLKKKIDREKVIPAKLVIEWAKQLSDVLEYLHTRKPNKIIYRDMKPHNIMLTPEGKIKLIDFGTAIKEDDNAKTINMGTEIYAAPEQIKNKITNERTDIYSLGITLYQLVTGKSKKRDEILKPIRQLNPMLPEGLEKIISKCIQIDPNLRYSNCGKLKKDLLNIDKLTKDYNKKVLKRIVPFIISLVIFIASIGTTILAKTQINNTNLNEYKTLLNEASTELVDGNKTRALEILDKAITEVDGSRAEAYGKIIDIYMTMGNVKVGLEKVEGYINDKFENINKNDQVLFKVAMTYLDMRNYPIALKYFQQIDKKKLPEVQYYRVLANSMSSMNINYTELEKELQGFENFVDGLPNDEKKLINYNTLANIYSSYKGQLSDANEKVIEIVNKAYSVLSNIDNKELELKYEIEFIQKLAQAYHSMGSNEKDTLTAQGYFNKSIDRYYELIDLNAPDKESTLIKIGDIHGEMKNYAKAIENYQEAIREVPNSVKAYSKLINILIDVEQSKDGGKNYDQIKAYFNTASGISGANENEDFKKLKRRMSNLQM